MKAHISEAAVEYATLVNLWVNPFQEIELLNYTAL